MNLRDLFKKKQEPAEEPNDEWLPPSADAVRRRLVILWCNCGRSHFESEHTKGSEIDAETLAKLREWVCGPLRDDASEHEISRHEAELGSYSKQDILNDWWDIDAAAVLQWALGLTDRLPAWDVYGEWDESTDELFDLADPLAWRDGLSLRPLEEIEAQAQSHEARYWRIRHLREIDDHGYAKKLMGRAQKLGQVELTSDGELAFSDGSSVMDAEEDKLSFSTSIVMERLHALNWLCGQDAGWDSITCDTIVSWLWDENWR